MAPMSESGLTLADEILGFVRMCGAHHWVEQAVHAAPSEANAVKACRDRVGIAGQVLVDGHFIMSAPQAFFHVSTGKLAIKANAE